MYMLGLAQCFTNYRKELTTYLVWSLFLLPKILIRIKRSEKSSLQKAAGRVRRYDCCRQKYSKTQGNRNFERGLCSTGKRTVFERFWDFKNGSTMRIEICRSNDFITIAYIFYPESADPGIRSVYDYGRWGKWQKNFNGVFIGTCIGAFINDFVRYICKGSVCLKALGMTECIFAYIRLKQMDILQRGACNWLISEFSLLWLQQWDWERRLSVRYRMQWSFSGQFRQGLFITIIGPKMQDWQAIRLPVSMVDFGREKRDGNVTMIQGRWYVWLDWL